MEPSVQETLREIIIRPIHAIGPNNPKLLGYLKEYSETADSFVLGILNAFTDGNRPPSIVSLVKTLLTEKGADARFLMLIIGEMDKVGHLISFKFSILKSVQLDGNYSASTKAGRHSLKRSRAKASCTTDVYFHCRGDTTD